MCFFLSQGKRRGRARSTASIDTINTTGNYEKISYQIKQLCAKFKALVSFYHSIDVAETTWIIDGLCLCICVCVYLLHVHMFYHRVSKTQKKWIWRMWRHDLQNCILNEFNWFNVKWNYAIWIVFAADPQLLNLCAKALNKYCN